MQGCGILNYWRCVSAWKRQQEIWGNLTGLAHAPETVETIDWWEVKSWSNLLCTAFGVELVRCKLIFERLVGGTIAREIFWTG
jgi:hypothetical protein